ERVLAKENAQFGLIAIRSANIFVGPPLTQLSFNGNITGNGGNCRILSAPTICSIDCAALSHDERTIAYSTSTAVKLVDLNTGREMRTLVGQNGRINNVTQSNKSIYSWASVSSDCTITIWDTRQHPANVLTRRLDRSANCLLFSPNDAFIAIGSDQLYMMDPRIRDMRSLPTSSQVLHVCFHPSYYLLATGSDDRLVRFWDIESEECVSKSEPSDGALKKIAFQNDGSLLFTLTDRRCGAICWEPFEVLGQCFLTDSNRSLTLTSNDSDVLLLAHSTVTNKISLSSLPIAVFFKELFIIGTLKYIKLELFNIYILLWLI
ncbi:unnamed protein product, partial [Dracunculus medinensis]|uniref:WD_REPEATS_REGION domain-containing protein n=1 Tax=Dracunculus medinensis TaxID=318479 RepID=A0A0N4U7I4_DRAME